MCAEISPRNARPLFMDNSLANRRGPPAARASGELAALRFRDLDLDRGYIALDENKTDDPRGWALDPHVASALRVEGRYREGAKDHELGGAGTVRSTCGR